MTLTPSHSSIILFRNNHTNVSIPAEASFALHLGFHPKELEVPVSDIRLGANERPAPGTQVGFLDPNPAGKAQAVLFGRELGPDGHP